MSERHNIHGTGILLGGHGVVLRGPSGAGKSVLALELLDAFEERRLPAMLVADDRVDLSVEGGRLVMHAPKSIEGLIELRGRGIVTRPFAATAPVSLVVDLVDTLVRLLEEDELVTELLEVELPRCPVPRAGVIDTRHQMLLVREGLRALPPVKTARRQKTT